MSNIIEIKNLSKRFDKEGIYVQELQDINLNIEEGEFISIIGSSGCGKSTLLRNMVVLDNSYEGEENGRKYPIVSNEFYPEYGIIDPELTYSMTPHITAGTGIDVLSHAIKGYWSKGHQPICYALSIYATDIVF